MIAIRNQPFDPWQELREYEQHGGPAAGASGAAAVFVGTMRDLNEGDRVHGMTLEHYPGMTEKAIAEIEAEALRRWPLSACLIIHRFGRLAPGDNIVLVATAAPHRHAAIEACQFLIDWLKTKAPFWKLEETEQGAQWVDARESDDTAAARWIKKDPDAAE